MKRKGNEALRPVVQLRTIEPVKVQEETIAALYAQLGPKAAERLLLNAVEELANTLVAMEAAVAGNDLPGLNAAIGSLVPLARKVGLGALEGVAHDLRTCMKRGDDIAAQAVLARILRLGDRSLSKISNIEDMRG
ncbi:hypothetical protein ERN12_09165 [Rhodobacteraceae bacterium]|nr:hypothetical protein ERN12_09165 [Paracoccaceae bacterium]